jgi:formate dehydrogenase (coenzyme F420) beta subunit
LIEELRKKAAELLESGDVKVVLGYGEGPSEGRVTAITITDPKDVDKLIFDERCDNNLALYLKKPEVSGNGKVAIVTKAADARAINVLLLESQLERENVIVLGVNLDGDSDWRKNNTPPIFDFMFGKEGVDIGWEENDYGLIDELEKMSPEERWNFWQEHLERCIKCYACRQVCPICTCTRCITDKNQPQWVPTSPTEMGNLHWNITRAFHLTGRCVQCGECTRACPMDIPLNLLNLKIGKEVFEQFDFKVGMNAEDPPPLATYKETDDESFIG